MEFLLAKGFVNALNGGVEQRSARQVHILKVVGSNPIFATNWVSTRQAIRGVPSTIGWRVVQK